MAITTESLAYWYFRLNGFLTIENLIVHVDLPRSRGQGTDVDILGVRFQYRSELKLDGDPMIDDEFFKEIDKPLIVLAEVKTGMCSLNGPWTDSDKGNMQRVLYALGAFPAEQIDEVARGLYEEGTYSSNSYCISILCIGKSQNRQLSENKPKVPQIIWDSVLSFIYKRFIEHENSKRPHPQWDSTGRYLWDTAIAHKQPRGVESFVSEVKRNI